MKTVDLIDFDHLVQLIVVRLLCFEKRMKPKNRVILFQKKYVKSMMKLAMEFHLLQKTIAYDLFKEN